MTDSRNVSRMAVARDAALLVLLAAALVVGMIVLPGAALAEDTMQKYHHAQTSPKVDYRGQFAAAGSLAESAAGQKLFEDCLAAYGGRDALAAVNGARLTYARPGDRGAETPGVVKSFARGRRYNVTRGDNERMIDGQKCWVGNGDQAKEMDDFRYRAELFSYLTLTMPLAGELEHFDDIRYGAGEDENLDYFFFSKNDSMLVVLGVDRDKHLIRNVAGLLPQEDESDIIYVNEFADFKTVEGIVFPHKVTHISLGMDLGHILLQQVDFNPDFAADEFSRQTKSP